MYDGQQTQLSLGSPRPLISPPPPKPWQFSFLPAPEWRQRLCPVLCLTDVHIAAEGCQRTAS